MRTLHDGSKLFSSADPSSYVRAYMDEEDQKGHHQIVPLDVLDRIFSSYNYKELIKTFLELSSNDQKIESIISSTSNGVNVPALWEKWQKDRGDGNFISFHPIPGINDTLEVCFLGDAYEWSVHEYGSGGGVLKRVVLACIENFKKRYHQEEPPQIVRDVELLFSLPKVTENSRVILDCSLLTNVIKNTFGIKLSPNKFARELSSNFIGGRDFVTLSRLVDGKDISVQCTLTAHHVFSEKEALEYEERNYPMDECMIGGCSTDDKSRFASLDKVVGTKIYLRQYVGMYYPPTFKLRFYFCYHYTKI